MKNRIIASVFVLLVFIGCAKTELNEYSLDTNKPGVYGVLPELIEDNFPITKASVDPITMKYQWQIGDRINIWSDSGTLLIYSVTETNGDRASFDGGGFTLTEGETYYSSHPLISSVLDQYESLSSSYEGQVQVANNDAAHMADHLFTYASGTCTNNSTSFQYHYLSAFLRVFVTVPETAAALTELTIEAKSDLFALEGKTSVKDGRFTPSPSKMSNVISLGLNDIEVQDGNLKAFLAFAPHEAGEFIVRLKDANGITYTSPLFSGKDVEAGHVQTFEVEVFEGDVAPLAQIGDVRYSTLADAIAAVPSDGTETTITMLGNEHIVGNTGVTIPIGKNIILDLNGHEVTQSAPDAKVSALINNNGTLTITDSSDTKKDGSGTGKMSSKADASSASHSYANNLISNRGQLTIESGYLESATQGGAPYVVDNYDNGNAVINGGHLYNYYSPAIRLFCNSTTAENNVIVNGGIVEGYCPIWVQSSNSSANKGSLTINGGVFKTTEKAVVEGTTPISEGDTYLYMYPSNANMSITITGGDFYTNIATWGDGTISVSGGIFRGYIYSGTQRGFITGGLFSVDESRYCAEGFVCVPSEEYPGMYEIGLAEVYYSWEEDGTMVGDYCSFEAPFVNDWLMDGEYITLLKNITLTRNVACLLEEGFFTLTQGEYNITKGEYSVSLNPGVRVSTDKQTDIFSAAEEGYEIVETQTANGYCYTALQESYAAEVNGVNYATLAEAIAAVPTDGTETTITMLSDEAIVAGVTIQPGQNIVIELNGKTISGNTDSSKTYALITNKGTLTIQDNTDIDKNGTGEGLITTYITNPDSGDVPGYASNTITNLNTLTVKSGRIVNNGSGYACYAIDNQTNGNSYTPLLIIEGGRMSQMNAYTYAVRMFCNSTTKENSVEISGGVIEGGYGLWLQTPNDKANMANLSISGGVFNANDGAALYVGGTKADNSKIFVNVAGGVINGTGVIIQGPLSGTYGEVSISGGEMNNVQCGANVEKFITGGVFHNNPSPLYLADGYIAVEDAGVYTVVENNVASINGVNYATLAEAIAAVPASGSETVITLLNDAVIAEPLQIAGGKSITLNLAGNKITGAAVSGYSGHGLFKIERGAVLNVNGSTAGSSIESGSSFYSPFVVTVGGDDATKTAVLNINGGTYSGVSAAISGNGNRNNTTVTITGATLSASDGPAIYHPQVGSLTITNSTLTGTGSAVEMRAGTLIVNSGSYTATHTPFSDEPNGNGNTIKGSAIAVSQHTTNYPISVTINGGTFAGAYALYEADVQDSTTDVSISVAGGTFNGGVYSENCRKFITGGSFANDPSAYVADGYEATLVDGRYTVQ